MAERCANCNLALFPHQEHCPGCGKKRPYEDAPPAPKPGKRSGTAGEMLSITGAVLGATAQGFGHIWRGMSKKQRPWAVGGAAVLALYGMARSVPPSPPSTVRPAVTTAAPAQPSPFTAEQFRRQRQREAQQRQARAAQWKAHLRRMAAQEERRRAHELAAARQAEAERQVRRYQAELAAAQMAAAQQAAQAPQYSAPPPASYPGAPLDYAPGASGGYYAPRPEDGAPRTVQVRGYYRRDGTYVAPYTRRAPR